MTSPNILEFLGGNGQDLGGPGSPLGARGWGGRASGILGVFLGSRQTKKEVREKSLLEHIPGVTRLRDIVDRIIPAEFEPFREAAAQILPVIAGGGGRKYHRQGRHRHCGVSDCKARNCYRCAAGYRWRGCGCTSTEPCTIRTTFGQSSASYRYDCGRLCRGRLC